MEHQIVVNGRPEPLEQSTLADLIARRSEGATRGVAVALNDAVVPRRAWPTTRLKAGDRIEIVKARAGG